jgi:hypothetical protein
LVRVYIKNGPTQADTVIIAFALRGDDDPRLGVLGDVQFPQEFLD